MGGTVINDVLVDFVGDRQDVPLLAEPGNELQLFAVEHLTGRIIRRINNDGLRAVVECRGQFFFIKRPVRPAKLNVTRRRTRDDRVRTIVFIEGLEHNHFIAGIDDGEQHIDHGFR